eukprot:860465-Pelagomonas_calceolata.AAC.2
MCINRHHQVINLCFKFQKESAKATQDSPLSEWMHSTKKLWTLESKSVTWKFLMMSKEIFRAGYTQLVEPLSHSRADLIASLYYPWKAEMLPALRDKWIQETETSTLLNLNFA